MGRHYWATHWGHPHLRESVRLFAHATEAPIRPAQAPTAPTSNPGTHSAPLEAPIHPIDPANAVQQKCCTAAPSYIGGSHPMRRQFDHVRWEHPFGAGSALELPAGEGALYAQVPWLDRAISCSRGPKNRARRAAWWRARPTEFRRRGAAREVDWGNSTPYLLCSSLKTSLPERRRA
jgi:hypothetical protein